jgi:pimeloyl-ACP methyl ester carboxylesterase
MVTPTLADEAAALNPNVEVVHIPGAGHNVRRENFEAYLAAVRAFLE